MTDMVKRTREVVARGDVLTGADVLAMADEIERLRSEAKGSRDAYEGARDDFLYWRRRAQRLEAKLEYEKEVCTAVTEAKVTAEDELRAKAEELYREHCQTIPGPPTPPLFSAMRTGPLNKKVQAGFLEKARAALADGET